jgi:hypothetical protein
MKKLRLALTLTTLLPVISFAAMDDFESPAGSANIASPRATMPLDNAIANSLAIKNPLPTKQSFTDVFAQAGVGVSRDKFTSTITADITPPTQSQSISSTSTIAQIGAGYRFAIDQDFRLGFGILADIGSNKAEHTFSYTIPLPTPILYKINMKLSHKYSVTPFVELSWADQNNLVSLFGGPSITQIARTTSYTIDSGAAQTLGTSYFTKTGMLVGASVEHNFNDLIGVFVKGTYVKIPEVGGTSQAPLIIHISSSKHGAHSIGGQVGVELHLG